MSKKNLDKINKEEIAKKGGKFVNDFKDFIAKGNVLDLAVGVVIGSAFGKIVSSIVDDIIMPIVGALIGIIAFCIFVFIRVISKFNRKPEEVVVEEVKKDEKVELLEEIRDLLKKDKK